MAVAIICQRWCCGFSLRISLARRGGSRILAPLGLQGGIDLLRVGELQVAHLLGDDCALMLRFELRDQLCLELAGLLGVQVTHLLRNINKRNDCFIMALLGSL